MFGFSWFRALCTIIVAIHFMATSAGSVIFRGGRRNTEKKKIMEEKTTKTERKTKKNAKKKAKKKAKTRMISDTAHDRIPTTPELTPSIPLSSGKFLSRMDLLRALCCSMAVYKDHHAEADTVFKSTQDEYPATDFSFEKIHMSYLDHPEKLKFLVAYASDAIFIAIRGSKTLADWSSNFRVDRKHLRHGGKVHTGFYNLSEMFLRKPYGLGSLHGLVQSGKRIIFCGHSMGGAVSHLTLLRYLLETDTKLTPELDTESLFSIAFGAPHVCDSRMASTINTNEFMRWRFITIVNQKDPVPSFLHDLPGTVLQGLAQIPSTFIASEPTLNTLVSIIGMCLRWQFAEASRTFVQLGVAKVTNPLCMVLRKPYRWLYRGLTQHNPESSYHQFGRYVFLTREGEERQWNHKIVDGHENEVMKKLLRMENPGKEDVMCHQIDCYKTALIHTSLLSPREAPSTTNANRPKQVTKLMVCRPEPEIHVASFQLLSPNQLSDPQGRHLPHELRIHGRNLLFVEEITVDGGHKQWEIQNPQTDSELVWVSKSSSASAAGTTERAVSTVKIKTAFGIQSSFIVEVLPESAQPRTTEVLIRHLVQMILVKSRPPLNRNSEEVLRQLDDMTAQCCIKFPQKLSEALKSMQKPCPGGVGIAAESVNQMVEAVLGFLESPGRRMDSKWLFKRSWDILYQGLACSSVAARGALFPAVVTAGSLLTVFPVRKEVLSSFPVREELISMAIPVGGALFAAFPVTASLAIGASIVLASAVVGFWYGICKGSIRIREIYYSSEQTSLELLPLAISEATCWSEIGAASIENCGAKNVVQAELEREFVKQVEASAKLFKEMIQHSYCNYHDCDKCRDLYGNLQLRSLKFKTAYAESGRNLLKWMDIVVTTRALYEKVVQKEKFVAVLGAKDAGKSTFIKDMIKKFGSAHNQVPEVGLQPADVTPYNVTEELILVDFPGQHCISENTDRWKQINMMPSSAVFLFLHFKGKLTDDQKEMYNSVKKSTGTNPIVIFNKVKQRRFEDKMTELDKIRKLLEDMIMQWPELVPTYFAQLRRKTAEALHCKIEDVNYMFPMPTELFNKLCGGGMHSVGVFNLETFADEVFNLKVTEPSLNPPLQEARMQNASWNNSQLAHLMDFFEDDEDFLRALRSAGGPNREPMARGLLENIRGCPSPEGKAIVSKFATALWLRARMLLSLADPSHGP